MNIRDAFMDGLIKLAAENNDVVVLDADVSRTTRTRRFRDAYPDRFYDIGIAEQNMVGAAAGLASSGCIPFVSTFSVFASMRAAEQVRTSICYPRLNAKIIGGYAGLSNAKDGATHQSVEDLAIMRALPNMTVISASDPTMAALLPQAVAAYNGPVFVRLEYDDVAAVYDDSLDYHIGQALVVQEGTDVTIASNGTILEEVMKSAKVLSEKGISVEILDIHTLKPFDKKTLCDSVKKTNRLVTVEIHNTIGGLASACCETLMSMGIGAGFKAVGINDVYTESGKREELLKKYQLDAQFIEETVIDILGKSHG
jgi:Transketolase, C-terminal subunit